MVSQFEASRMPVEVAEIERVLDGERVLDRERVLDGDGALRPEPSWSPARRTTIIGSASRTSRQGQIGSES
jgi:hypothetical protein